MHSIANPYSAHRPSLPAPPLRRWQDKNHFLPDSLHTPLDRLDSSFRPGFMTLDDISNCAISGLRRILIGAAFVLLGVGIGGLTLFRARPPNPWGLFLGLVLVLLGIAYVSSDETISEAIET